MADIDNSIFKCYNFPNMSGRYIIKKIVPGEKQTRIGEKVMSIARKYFVFILAIVFLLVTSCGGDKDAAHGTAPVNTQDVSPGKPIYASYLMDENCASIAAGVNGDIYLVDQRRIYILDSEGNRKKKIENENKASYILLESADNGFLTVRAVACLKNMTRTGTRSGNTMYFQAVNMPGTQCPG